MCKFYVILAKYRNLVACIIAVLTFYVIPGDLGNISESSLSAILRGVATIMAALGVVAYNLRCRVFDATIKLINDNPNYKDISKKSLRCGKKLTHIVLISLAASIFSFIANIFTTLFCVSIAFSTFGVVQYIYVLYTFQRLEKALIIFYVKKRDDEEISKRKVYIENEKIKNPDTGYHP